MILHGTKHLEYMPYGTTAQSCERCPVEEEAQEPMLFGLALVKAQPDYCCATWDLTRSCLHFPCDGAVGAPQCERHYQALQVPTTGASRHGMQFLPLRQDAEQVQESAVCPGRRGSGTPACSTPVCTSHSSLC